MKLYINVKVNYYPDNGSGHPSLTTSNKNSIVMTSAIDKSINNPPFSPLVPNHHTTNWLYFLDTTHHVINITMQTILFIIRLIEDRLIKRKFSKTNPSYLGRF